MKLTTLFIIASQVSVLLPVIAGLSVYKKLTQPFRLFLYFFILSAGFEIQSRIASIVFHNNMPGMHLFVVVEFLAYSTIYYLSFKKNSAMRLLIAVNAAVLIGIASVNVWVYHNIKVTPTQSISYSSSFYSHLYPGLSLLFISKR